MAYKRVLICHERFLPRFGADRVLIIIGQKLLELGWRVDFMGYRFPDDRLQGIADRLIEIPAPSEYILFDVETASWLQTWFASADGQLHQYDLVVLGGWPFFSTIGTFRERVSKVVFIDCGVVPNSGYDENTQRVLNHLRVLRKQHLSLCTHVAANSRFTLESQTLPEVDAGPSCRAILNGIDHLNHRERSRPLLPAKPLLVLRALKAEGRKPILLLGRYEKFGYKNSLAGLEMIRILRRADPSAALLVLERQDSLQLDWELAGHVFGLGSPDDSTLVDLMLEVELGVSVSLWEGFNLPIAEMYRLGRPALCFDLAAHPEVVLRPWFLCKNVLEMAAKAATILCGASKVAEITSSEVSAYCDRFTWRDFMNQLLELTGA